MILNFQFCRFFLLLCILCGMATSLLGDQDDFLADEGYSLESSAPSTPAENLLTFTLIPEKNSVQPGDSLWLAIKVNIHDHWHSYWKNPGDVGIPLKIDWTLPEGFTVDELEWPYPKRFEQDGLIGYGYEGNVTLLARMEAPATPKTGDTAKITANLRSLVCSDSSCVPGEDSAHIDIMVSTESPKLNPEAIELFAKTRAQLPKKLWNFQAKRSGHFIELHMQTPTLTGEPFHHAHFFPESRKMIDGSGDTLLKKSADKPGHYVLMIKDLEVDKSAVLKGVLVLHSENQPDGIAEALEVDIPILTKESDEIASATIPKQLIEKSQSDEMNEKATDSLVDGIPGEQVEFEGGLALALLFAFLGGLLLNLMPCVLPVISFKILSFVKMAGQSRAETFKHGLAFSAGVIVSFWLFAGALLFLQAYGRSVGWGFQLQEPLFVAFLAALLLVFGLSMFGVFEMGTSMTSYAGQVQHNTQKQFSALLGSFFSGVLATAVATPCTGPFLGSAVGFAVTLPPISALTVFTVLGLGMATPYLIFAAFPSLLRFLPKPGDWMITFKEIMGFVMLTTVLWLVWVFGAQTNSFATFLLLAGFLVLSVAAWIYGRWCTPVQAKTVRMVGSVFAIACAIVSAYIIFAASSPAVASIEGNSSQYSKDHTHGTWEEFSVERLTELQNQGTPVLIDFTAKWCLICQANHLVLSTSEVEQAIQDKGVVKMKADWTRNDPVITKMLRKFGRNGVPLYLLYGKDSSKQPRILPQMLTPDLVVDAVNQL